MSESRLSSWSVVCSRGRSWSMVATALVAVVAVVVGAARDAQWVGGVGDVAAGEQFPEVP